MTPLDPLAIDLGGVQLIEASAGTGKTHTIATLFVRLVLEKKLAIDRILVVTFTNAATAELRDRIRKRLRDAVTAFEVDTPALDSALRGLVARSRNREADRRRLATALAAVDEATVLTIHGFCQRILSEHSFDGGVRAELELVPDVQPLIAEIVHDFWSRRLEHARPAEVEYLRSSGLHQKDLLSLGVLAARLPDARVVVDSAPADVGGALDRYFAAKAELAAVWPEDRDAVRAVLVGSGVLNGNRYSSKICERLVTRADDLVASGPTSFAGWSDELGKLATSAIVAGTNKNKAPPMHRAFTLFEALVESRRGAEGALHHYAQGLQLELVHHVRAELAVRAAARSIQSFDDVLNGLRDALRGRRSRALAVAVRRRFPAALIDEFHDTDPVQYEIFRQIYAARGTSLFLIGDPKQAIYVFRGADVFAYLGAAQDADARSTLATNYRSDPSLVAAVNTLFSSTESPFLLDEIRFDPVGTPQGAEDRLDRDGRPWSGLEFVVVPRPELEPGRKAQPVSLDAVPGIVAGEIARMLSPMWGVRLGDKERASSAGGLRALVPGDFAVLTRKNAETHDVQRALRALGIPSVLHGDASVLETDEAAELALVLRALADPKSATAVRSALSTSLLGLGASELFALGEDEAAWEAWVSDFEDWHATWKQRGFLPAVRRLLRDRRGTARLLGTVGGERKLTNLLHLTELCHQKSMADHLGIAGLLAWFDEVRHDERAREGLAAESQQIRLESDERAVQLTTMHRSKGLEYPVVLLPYLFRGSRLFPSDRVRLRYHDPARHHELVLDLRPEDQKLEEIAHAEREAMAEGLRLTYVALTRARHRTVVLWGAFSGFGESALARLLHPGVAMGGAAEPMDDPSILRDVSALATASGGTLSVRRHDPRLPAPPYRADPTGGKPLSGRTAARRLSMAFRTSSWSALVAQSAAAAPPNQDERDVDQHTAPAFDARVEAAATDSERVPLDEFPRGPVAGDVLHAILEHADFERRDADELPRLVREHLTRQGFDAARWTDPLARALGGVLATPLLVAAPTLSLSRIPRARRLSEMEFTFPVADARKARRSGALLTATALAGVLRRRAGPFPPSYADRVAALDFGPLTGFLRGFVDSVFEHEGRFYVVDYKSNHLGPKASSYEAPLLAAPMAHHHYVLQYHLYLVALHRYLGTRLPGYDYGRHMGGAVYLFLRGMSPDRGAKTGVFFDLPPEETIEELSRVLGAGTPREEEPS